MLASMRVAAREYRVERRHALALCHVLFACCCWSMIRFSHLCSITIYTYCILIIIVYLLRKKKKCGLMRIAIGSPHARGEREGSRTRVVGRVFKTCISCIHRSPSSKDFHPHKVLIFFGGRSLARRNRHSPFRSLILGISPHFEVCSPLLRMPLYFFMLIHEGRVQAVGTQKVRRRPR